MPKAPFSLFPSVLNFYKDVIFGSLSRPRPCLTKPRGNSLFGMEIDKVLVFKSNSSLFHRSHELFLYFVSPILLDLKYIKLTQSCVGLFSSYVSLGIGRRSWLAETLVLTLNNPETWQPQNSTTPKLDDPNTPQKEGPGEGEQWFFCWATAQFAGADDDGSDDGLFRYFRWWWYA